MAYLRDLIEVLAEQDPRGFSTVDYVARALRKKKIVKPSVRGRGATSLDEQDAAAVIIGLNTGETLSKAPAATEAFWALTPVLSVPDAPVHHYLRLLMEERCFGDAIARLVTLAAEVSAMEDSTEPLPHVGDPEAALLDGVDATRALSIVVDFFSPQPTARIRIRSHLDHGGNWLGTPQRFDLHYRAPPQLARHGDSSPVLIPDRRVRSTITLRTFEAVHSCIFSQPC